MLPVHGHITNVYVQLTCTSRIPHFKPHGKIIYFSKAEMDRWLMKNPVKTKEQVEREAASYAISPMKKK